MHKVDSNFLEKEAAQHHRNLTVLVVAIFIGCCLSFAPDIYLGLWENLWYAVFPVTYLLTTLILRKYVNVEVAAHFFLLMNNLCVFYFAHALGRLANVHFIFFILIFLTPSILSLRNKYGVLLYIVLPLFLLATLVGFDFTLPYIPKMDTTLEDSIIFGKMNVILIGCVFPIVAGLLISSYKNVFDEVIRSEAILRQKNKELLKTNQELDNFVYSVSHDLRAPISSVLGLINIAKQETDTKQLAYYETLKEKSLLKLDSFIKDILDYSRNARLEVTPTAIHFQNHVLQLIQQFEYLPEAEGVDIEVDIQQEGEFYTDEYRLNIILNNLVSNAFRYSDKGKSHPFIKISGKVDNQKAFFRVADNGIGIESQYLDKIFDMFYRATESSKGSGLGLYILKETLEKVKGKIRVRSTYRKGSVFSIELPNLRPNS